MPFARFGTTDPSASIEQNLTPLMISCMYDAPICTKMLLESDADPNLTNAENKTALLIAKENNNHECVKAFTETERLRARVRAAVA